MFQPRAFALLSNAERQLIRQPLSKSTQCLRCFQTSRRTRADENPSAPKPSNPSPESNDAGTPYNTPNLSSTRQQRAAQASSEVSALAADLPTSNLSGRNAEHQGAQQRDPGVSPQARGETTRPGVMGETEGPGKEGPYAQPVGRFARAVEEDPVVGKPPRGAQEPVNLGGAVKGVKTTQPTADAPVQTTQKQTPTKRQLSAEDYLHLGQNGHTIAANNYPGILRDRINLIAPSHGPSHSSVKAFEHRLITRGSELTSTRPTQPPLLRNESVQRREEEAKEKGMDQRPMKGRPRFSALRKEAREGVVDRLVRGKYDPQGLLRGKEVHKQSLLNEVAKLTLKNSTYLASDGEKLLRKVRTLLPAAAAAGGKKAQAAKK